MKLFYEVIGAVIAVAITGVVSFVLIKKSNSGSFYDDYVYSVLEMLIKTDDSMSVNATMLNDGSSESFEEIENLSIAAKRLSMDVSSKFRGGKSA